MPVNQTSRRRTDARTKGAGWLTLIAVGLLCIPILGGLQAAESKDTEHAALRELNQNVTKALNSADFTALQEQMASTFDITFADQKHLGSMQSLKDYHAQLTSPDGPGIVSMHFEPQADALTRFIGNDVGITHGTSVDTFTKKNGDKVVLHSCWTATMVKENGKWKVSALHAGVDFLDNPILQSVKGGLMSLVYAGAGIALVVGIGLGFVIGRRKAA